MSERLRSRKKTKRSKSIASRADSPAKGQVTPDLKVELPTTQELVYGENMRGSFAVLDRALSSWKMLKAYSPTGGEWIAFSRTWPDSGTMLNGICYPQRPLASRKFAQDYSLWPLPMASDYRRLTISRAAHLEGMRRNKVAGAGNGPSCGNLIMQMKIEFDCCPSLLMVETMMGFPIGWTELGD